MSVQVMLTVPDELYRRAESLAKARAQDVSAVLAAAIVVDWPFLPEDEEQRAMAREEAAYRAMHATLHAQHVGQYVAIYQGKLVDRDKDFATICDRVDERYPGQVVLITRVRSTPEETIVIRSPQIEYVLE